MPRKLRSHVIDCVVALVATAIAVLLRSLLDPWMGHFRPFFTIYWAIGIVACARGYRPALITAASGYVACDYFFATPRWTLFTHAYGSTGILVYALVSSVFIGIGHAMRAVRLRLHAERERLRDSHEFHEAIAGLTADFAFAGRIGPDGEMVIKTITDGFTNLLGYTRTEITDKADSWKALIHPDDAATAESAMRRLVAGETVEGELRSLTKDGRVVWLRFRHRPVRDEHDRVVSLIGAVQDITERKLAEATLRDIDRRKDEFLATLSHELRNPLAPICNALELMRSGKHDPALMEQARDIMGRQVQQLVRLIDDLLDVSRITQGKLQLRKEPMDLVTAVQIAIEANRPLIDGSAHELIVTLPPTPIMIEADLTRITQVLSNLLNNATKYTENGGRICLTVERHEDDAIVTVKDNGIGISADHLPYVFEMFSQTVPAIERAQGGLGIGLSLVRRLIEAHGGYVEARSAGPGQGSEFVIHLQIVESPPEMSAPAMSPAEISTPDNVPSLTLTRPASACRILLVDDNLDATEGLGMMLQYFGHETHVAHDGMEAIEQAEALKPHVVLLDIGLPKKNGYEVARHIRNQPWGSQIILIALTGWGHDGDKQRARDAGFDHHLSKPVKSADLQRVIESLLNGSRANSGHDNHEKHETHESGRR